MSNSTPRKGLKRQVGLSLFSAIIVVLTVLGNFVRFGPVPITLSLAPIIIGAAVYGSSAGALLGGVLLGIIEIFAKAYISTQLSDAIVFAVLIVVLIVRPAGLLGKQVREKV